MYTFACILECINASIISKRSSHTAPEFLCWLSNCALDKVLKCLCVYIWSSWPCSTDRSGCSPQASRLMSYTYFHCWGPSFSYRGWLNHSIYLCDQHPIKASAPETWTGFPGIDTPHTSLWFSATEKAHPVWLQMGKDLEALPGLSVFHPYIFFLLCLLLFIAI